MTRRILLGTLDEIENKINAKDLDLSLGKIGSDAVTGGASAS
jgi:hypothetical protein